MWPRFLSRLRETFSLDSDVAQGEQLMALVQTHAVRTPTLQPAELQRLRQAVDAFPPRPIADFLLSVCIDHGTDAFFYFNQAQFLAEVDEFYTNPTSRLRRDCSFVCLAHAAFALGSQWTTLAKPDGSRSNLNTDDSDPGRIFYNQARSLIPDVIDFPGLRSVQAPFVLGVYLLPASAIGSSYIYLGLALRKALAMDLHLNTDELNLSEEEKEIRRRVWWSIYSLERSSTVKLNRPRSINTSIITVSLPKPCPPLDNIQRFNNIEHQIADARLMMILDKVAEPLEWSATQSLPIQLESDLKAWKRSLPASLKLQNMLPQSPCYRATFHLYSNYYFSWIAMGKVSVVTVVKARLRHHFRRESQPPQLGEHIGVLANSCIKAAKKMLLLFEDLRRTAGILERDANYERQVAFGLDCLSKMAEGNVAAKMGVSFVEALQSIADEAVDKLSETETFSNSPRSRMPLSTSDYNSWLNWLSQQNTSSNKTTQVPSQSNPVDTLLPTPTAGPWPTAQLTTAGLTTWDGVAALQQLSVPPMETTNLDQGNQPPSYGSQNIYPDFTAPLYNDDQTFLMGLTGFDVLGFTDGQDGGF
ncbi:hypothetical protein JX265_011197 [Neoarthrinium moseri]|uniref:Xylanolytic transcriptional activator regulatory domain-containing protein n=1 Tax=Neoarthrinium moseri TaxID=1658444 RepID=A0A9P9WCP1_9PEZI|nr:uncharacterized protein JN550_010501 [Neoarthrinium moseri]KAI1845907.1 hypothetical protein JX266_007994 [Neoarthrinium moseri]KAI1857462.1 hypothetical protein JX265_011197 [Neoarthrinium moseri]KAI1862036.1 hypothetical protein JN550_010501 [Neoarthrinium moseri]